MLQKLHACFVLFALLLSAADAAGWRNSAQSAQSTVAPSQTESSDAKDPKKGNAPSASPAAPPTASTPAAPSQQAAPADAIVLVWVNTESGVYHKAGSRFYGKTKQGKYMTEGDAIKAGYHAAKKSAVKD